MSISSNVEPKSYIEASKSDCRVKAMQQELTTSEFNHTWVLSDIPSHKNAIGCCWVYEIKHKPDGSIELYKA